MADHVGAMDRGAVVALVRAELASSRRVRARRMRRLMAVGIVAASLGLLPLLALAANPFDDLNPGSVHNANIDALYEAGVTRGCDPDVSYCPNGNVTREEMASFIARLGGLGDNPPVANAKTAETAASATNATNAGNATTVGGYAPAGLVRTARAISEYRSDVSAPNPLEVTTVITGLPYPATLDPLVTLSITAPTNGFVLVIGSAIINPSDTVALIRLRHAETGATSIPTGCGLLVNEDNACAVSPNFVFPVGAGTQTFVLEVAKGNANSVLAHSGVLNALYVPFGPTGGSTLDLP